jgi:hypothetical protein
VSGSIPLLAEGTNILDEPGVKILKSDESCISNPEIRDRRLDCLTRPCESNLRFLISGFEMQDSSDFKNCSPCLSSWVSQIY